MLPILVASSASAGEIDFEAFNAGDIVSEVFTNDGIGPILVQGTNPAIPGANVAMVFDSAAPTGGDSDLGTPNQTFGGPGIGAGGMAGQPYQNDEAFGKILILSEDLDSSDPDDADVVGSSFHFNFAKTQKGKRGTVTVNSVTLLDVESSELAPRVFVELAGPDIPTSMFTIPATGDNGKATIDLLGLSGVSQMRVNVNGSAGLAAIVIGQGEERACWITTGGFQNAGVQSGGKDFTFGGNVGPPPSGSWEVVDHNTGDNFHSNDVHIVDCLKIDTSGPDQPGGKKGFIINKALFAGTGRLNGVDGYPFEGYVIDAGEPQGKRTRANDEFFLVATDPVSGEVVFQAKGKLDGGNVQIHPPNPAS